MFVDYVKMYIPLILSVMLKDEFKYYLKNQDELVKRYNGRVLVIKDKQVHADFLSNKEALKWGREHFEPGTFIIQLCTPGPDAYTKHFNFHQLKIA